MEITLKTLTPLWTGGVNGDCDRLHETGIIGSLRWWYEAIVRGLGGSACDPTESSCRFEEKKFKQPERDTTAAWRVALRSANLCDVCQAYGATGWARRFKLHIRGGQQLNYEGSLNIVPPQRNRGWHLPPGWVGRVVGHVIPRVHFLPGMLIAPLYLASEWGALGARTQHGYGVFQGEVKQDQESLLVDKHLLQELPSGSNLDDHGLPSLRNMFWAKITFQVRTAHWWQRLSELQQSRAKVAAWVNAGSVPVSPSIRNQIRYLQGVGLSEDEARNYFFGSSKEVYQHSYQRVRNHHGRQSTFERTKTRLHISAAYPVDEAQQRWQVRIWGWLPHTLPAGLTLDRDVTLQCIYDLLGQAKFWQATLGPQVVYQDLVWREFNSVRDSTLGVTTDMLSFLQDLLCEEDGK